MGDDAIRAWYDAQEAEVRAAFDAAVRRLRALPRRWWRRRTYAELGTAAGRSRQCAGLAEIRIEVGKPSHHWRVLGYFVPGADEEFVLLYPFEKDRDPGYERACARAQHRKREVENDSRRSQDCVFP